MLSGVFGNVIGWPFLVVSIAVIAVVNVAVYLYATPYLKRESLDLNDRALLLFCVATFVIVWLLSSYAGEEATRSVALDIYAALLCVAVLVILFGVFTRTRLVKEKEVTARLLAMQEEQRQLAQESVELINIKCHDLKHHILGAVGDIGDANRKEIENAIKIYDLTAETGNKTLDTLLMEKGLRCSGKNIQFTYMVDGAALSFIDKVDLYTLLANALDNAIEAADAVAEKEKRAVTLQCKALPAFVSILIENYTAGTLRLVGGLPQTSKEDKNIHGFGTRSMRYILEKYGGELAYAQEGDKVSLSMAIPRPVAQHTQD